MWLLFWVVLLVGNLFFALTASSLGWALLNLLAAALCVVWIHREVRR